MRAFILFALVLINIKASAQNNTSANIIEGGKTLVELVRVFKTPKNFLNSIRLHPKEQTVVQ